MTEDRLTVRPPLDGRAAAGAAPGEDAAAPPQEPTLEDELAQLAAQRDEYLAIAQRTQADFENYRKRAVRDATLAEQRGVGRLAREVLPALDDLERALAAAGDQTGE